MAAGAHCDNHPEDEAHFIIGNADTGEQSWFCLPCTASFGLVMAVNFLDPNDVVKAGQEQLAKIAADGQEIAPPGAKPKSKPKGKPKATKRGRDLEAMGEKPPAPDAG